MSAPDRQNSQLDVDVARIESAATAHPTRVLVTAALCAMIIGALALVLDWQSAIGDAGVAVRVGWSAAPLVVAVMIVAALALLAVAWWKTEQPAWAGWAAAGRCDRRSRLHRRRPSHRRRRHVQRTGRLDRVGRIRRSGRARRVGLH